MKRPTFFISSTIYDFSDLRSAIKYFLEEQGCKVLASEYNDFRKPLDAHSYEACLKTIHQADYFLLLVGSRVGGWFDEERRISITQREYREAYELHLKGNLQILNFVRSDIWNLRFSRAELLKHLKALDLDELESKKIANHQTKRANDPEFIINFINEIGRITETKEATSGDGEFPTGNWIHSFSSFRDIADVIAPEIFDGLPIDEAITRRLLLLELKSILRDCLMKLGDSGAHSPKIALQKFYDENTIDYNFNANHRTVITTLRWNTLRLLAVHLLGFRLTPLILQQALSSSVFLDFNLDKGTFEETLVYKALYLLRGEIRSLNIGNTSARLAIILEESPKKEGQSAPELQVKTEDLLVLLHLLNRWSNTISLSKAIIQYLEGNDFCMPDLFEKSPIEKMNKELESEVVTDDELNSFIQLSAQ